MSGILRGVFVLIALLSINARAEWLSLNKSSGSSYVDPTSVMRNGSVYTVYKKENYMYPIPFSVGSAYSARILVEVSCEEKTSAWRHAVWFSDRDLGGAIVREQFFDNWRLSPNEEDAELIKVVCRKN
ncbi:MAG: hypothetical protein FJ184_11420 [Gammaproteobacteria bacterium]|nr:hypothetical protein [Gammaproteobacteria bacterium]